MMNNIFITDKSILPLIEEGLRRAKYNLGCCYRLEKYILPEEERSIFIKIKLDEMKCVKMLENIYKRVIGKEIEIPDDNIETSGNLKEEFKKLMFRKMDCLELYKNIYINLNNTGIRDIIFGIIMDSHTHIQKLNYLYNTNN